MTQWAVEVRNLTTTFNGSRRALENVSLAIALGDGTTRQPGPGR